MAFHLSQASLEAAVRHLCRYGDTDIFPRLPELAFFADEEKEVVKELATLDLDSYAPAGAIEALFPKGRYSFRIAHQLPALDTLLFLACVVEIGEKIEAKRQPVARPRAFSYRFSVDVKSGQLFSRGSDIQRLAAQAAGHYCQRQEDKMYCGFRYIRLLCADKFSSIGKSS
jgi:hypothetical protein